jgi:two-component system sensor histidine kinase/response regulator
MPEMDGYELTTVMREIEAAEGRPRTPIFAWTANALADEAKLCHAAGMDELLIKPIEMTDLHAALSRWLQIPAGNHGRVSVAETSGKTPGCPVDVRHLQDLVGYQPEVVREFFGDFQKSAQLTHSLLRVAVLAGDVAAARDAAHRLKSPAYTVGAVALGDLCALIEDACKKGQGKRLEELVDRLGAELSAVTQFMASWQG